MKLIFYMYTNFFKWQKVNGFCPLPVTYGDPGSGKTKAGNARAHTRIISLTSSLILSVERSVV